MTKDDFPTAEARDLLARRSQAELSVGQDPAGFAAQKTAASRVIDAVVALDGVAGWRISHGEGPIASFFLSNAVQLLVGFSDDGAWRVFLYNKEYPVKGMSFDLVDQQWVGTHDDTFLAPVPGERRRKRAAAAVLVDAVFDAIQARSRAVKGSST